MDDYDDGQGVGQGGQGDQGAGKVNPIQVQKFLEGIDYPASKQDLINKAKEKGADEKVMAALERLPEQMYETPVDISEAMGKME